MGARIITQLFIDGAYEDAAGGGTFETLDPADNRPIAELALGDAEDIDRAVAAARRAFEEGPWPRMRVEERCRILRRMGDLITERSEALAELESRDAGKPVRETRRDLARAANNFYFFAEYVPHYANEAYPSRNQFLGQPVDLLTYTRREPVGVAGLMTPWNSPMMQASWKVAPCLACGNTAVLKPSEMAPLTACHLGEIAQEAELPPGVLNVVPGFGATAGAALSAHPDVPLLAFTGGGTGGEAVLKAAAPRFKRVCLEMGGKAANIVFPDADLDTAVSGSVMAIFRHAGQSCLAGSRLFLHETIYDTFLERFLERVRALTVGPPSDARTDVGPLISRAHRERVERFVEAGREEGARLLAGGQRPDDPALAPGNYYLPTVFGGVEARMRIAREEIFGPVLAVLRFRDEAEVLRMANDTPYGLADYVWTRDTARALRMADALRAGMVWINSFFVRDLHTPFGGARQSGLGREGGRYGVEFYTEPKLIAIPY